MSKRYLSSPSCARPPGTLRIEFRSHSLSLSFCLVYFRAKAHCYTTPRSGLARVHLLYPSSRAQPLSPSVAAWGERGCHRVDLLPLRSPHSLKDATLLLKIRSPRHLRLLQRAVEILKLRCLPRLRLFEHVHLEARAQRAPHVLALLVGNLTSVMRQ